MSLAYLAETAIVFNLAYLELKKTRYLEHVKGRIEKELEEVETAKRNRLPKKDEEQNRPVENVAFTKADEEFKKSLGDMLSADPENRAKSWFDGKHKDWLAKSGYEIFDSGADKRTAQRTLSLSTLLLVGLILYDRFGMDQPVTDIGIILGSFIGGCACVFSIFIAYWPFKFSKICLVVLIALAVLTPFTPVQPMTFGTGNLSLNWWLFFALLCVCNIIPAAFVSLGRRIQATLTSSIDKAKQTREKAQRLVTKPFVDQAVGAD